MGTKRRAMSWVAVVGGMAVATTACGGDAGDSTAEDATPAASADVVASAADPCALVSLGEWESATGLSGLQLDRDGAETCDVLDDTNARVAGSVGLLDPSILDATRDMFETVAVGGIGDDAFWVATGMLYVQHGNRAFSVMVNPLAVDENREVAERLARVALSER